jgi:hypothetical protein
MSVGLKASNNGFVDATKKLICLPSYLMPTNERHDSLKRSAAAVPCTPTFYKAALNPSPLNEMASINFTYLNDPSTVPVTGADAMWTCEWDVTSPIDNGITSKNPSVTAPDPVSTMVMLGGAPLFSMHRGGDGQG